jgi:hypothetical protein
MISSFGSHQMRVVFNTDGFGTANGFNAFYEIRPAFKEEVPAKGSFYIESQNPTFFNFLEGSDAHHCGFQIQANDEVQAGYFTSPGFPIK